MKTSKIQNVHYWHGVPIGCMLLVLQVSYARIISFD